jgi:hypothetical protein
MICGFITTPTQRAAISDGHLQLPWANVFPTGISYVIAIILTSQFNSFAAYCVGNRRTRSVPEEGEESWW